MCRRLLKGLSRILKGTHIRDFDRHVTSLGHQSEELSERGPKFFNYVPYLFPGGGAKNFSRGFRPPGYGPGYRARALWVPQ